MRFYFILLLCLLVAGCSQQPQTPTSLTGEQGVVLSVVQEPDQVFEGEEFSITYSLENMGAQEVTPDSPGGPGVLIFSVDKLYLEEIDRVDRYVEPYFWLRPRTLYAEGETGFVTGYFRARNIDRSSSSVNTAVLASMCYPYNSTVTTQVCLEATREVDSGSIVCRNTPVVPPTPAGPIGVEKIDVRTTRASNNQVLPQFRLQIRNYDSGVPATSSCDALQAGTGRGLNELYVHARLLDEQLECTGGGEDGSVKLINGRGSATCSVSETSSLVFGQSQSNYLSLLTVELSYTYRDSVRSDIQILR